MPLIRAPKPANAIGPHPHIYIEKNVNKFDCRSDITIDISRLEDGYYITHGKSLKTSEKLHMAVRKNISCRTSSTTTYTYMTFMPPHPPILLTIVLR